MSSQKGLDAPQDTQQFAYLQSTSSHYLNLIFHGWDTELAAHRQKVAGDMCKTPSPTRKNSLIDLWWWSSSKEIFWEQTIPLIIFMRANLVDITGNSIGMKWLIMGEQGLVPHWVPPQAVGFQSSVHSLIPPPSLDGKKDIIQNDWSMAESSPVTASLHAKSLKVSLALTFGIVRFTDLQGTVWALQLSNAFLKARLRALDSFLTYVFKHNFSPIFILSEQPYSPVSSHTCHQDHTF